MKLNGFYITNTIRYSYSYNQSPNLHETFNEKYKSSKIQQAISTKPSEANIIKTFVANTTANH